MKKQIPNRTIARYLGLCLLIFVLVRAQAQEFPAGKYTFLVKDLKGARLALSTKSDQEGVTEITFTFKRTDSSFNKFSVSWLVPMKDIVGCWTSNSDDTRFTRMRSMIQSNISSHAPVLCVFGSNSTNRHTFALSDALHQSALTAGIDEEKSAVNCSATVSLNASDLQSDYSVTLLLDDRTGPYSDVLKNVSRWWAAMPRYHPAATPATAKMPMYSTWYSYHQNFTAQQLLDECTKAKQLGYETIIVDDGWQTAKAIRGYGYTGDWNPDRLPDMAGFVRKVHALGMKCMLWYSVPFVGYYADAYKRFKGKYLSQNDRRAAAILDPRYPDVRAFLIDKYATAQKQWGLDGFKLDFIDSFTGMETVVPPAGKDADIASLYDAVDTLMAGIKKRLTAVNPEVLIEFRQSYTGPAMRKYGNMFRAGDCPDGAIANRIRTTDVKLLAGTSATHSDMLTWNKDEPASIAALQFLNVLFAVPQLSVRLNEIPTAQMNMVRFYTSYWLHNRDILLNGDFKPFHPELNYPILISTKNNKTIIGLYADLPVEINDKIQQADIINAKTTEEVQINLQQNRTFMAEIFNCEGKLVESRTIHLNKGINSIKVPLSGLLKMRKMH
ncbi:MAG: alpha-galactosidase [Niabella sp.]|nr:alpha-galactosidase [Niabella sp.]